MAIGTKNGSHEYIMFIEVSGEFGSDFDWEYARTRCVSHENGEPKHSLWMSVYRVLEHIPTDVMGAMYLTTADGRSLVLEQAGFAASLTNPDEHVSVPRVAFADLKVIDFDDMTTTGNIGAAYDRNLEHLKECIRDVTSSAGKPSKNVERSVGAFSYQIIGDGVFIGDRTGVVMYEMPDITSIRRNHYEWGRSAMLF
jgi:hypothetical protein